LLVNLGLTMLSGQPPHFIWVKDNGVFKRVWNGKIIELKQDGKGKIESNDRKFANFTLRSQDDLKKIYSKIAIDSFIKKAVKDYEGMRITQSPVWEATACFVLSSNNSISNIRNSVQLLMKKFGEKTEGMYEFPSIESIAKAKEPELRECKAGFRAKYLKCAANLLLENDYNFDSKDKAKEFLLECQGIGGKVAECICLFGYGFLDSFPVDVWIKRAMDEVYFQGKHSSIDSIQEKAGELWGSFQGYANHYLFYEFMSKKRK